MDKVRIGIIGCGGIANNKHMPSLANCSSSATNIFITKSSPALRHSSSSVPGIGR